MRQGAQLDTQERNRAVSCHFLKSRRWRRATTALAETSSQSWQVSGLRLCRVWAALRAAFHFKRLCARYNGADVRIPRGRPTLAPNAVPTILPNLPAYLRKSMPAPRPQTKRRQVSPADNGETKRHRKDINLPAPEDDTTSADIVAGLALTFESWRFLRNRGYHMNFRTSCDVSYVTCRLNPYTSEIHHDSIMDVLAIVRRKDMNGVSCDEHWRSWLQIWLHFTLW